MRLATPIKGLGDCTLKESSNKSSIRRHCWRSTGSEASMGTTPIVDTCGYTPPTHTFNNSNGVVCERREGAMLLGALREHGGVKGHGMNHQHSSLTRIRLKQSSRAYFARTSAGTKLDVICLANLWSPYIFTYNERQTITSPPKTPPLTPHFKNSSSSAINCQNVSNTHRVYFRCLFDCIFVCFGLHSKVTGRPFSKIYSLISKSTSLARKIRNQPS